MPLLDDVLDDTEAAGLPEWEERHGFHLLCTEQGMAIITDRGGMMWSGIVRYPDHVVLDLGEAPTLEALKEKAEQCLAERPYETSYEKLLGHGIGDEDDPPAAKKLTPLEQLRPELPKATPARVWTTTLISRGYETDD